MATTPVNPERLVSLSEVKELLEKAEAARGDLSYEQKLAMQHAQRFAKYTAANAQKLVAELTQNPKIDLPAAIRVVDVAPAHADDVRAIFSKSRVTLDESDIQKILESVQKYAQS